MALPHDFDLDALLRAGQSLRDKTPAGLAAGIRVRFDPSINPNARPGGGEPRPDEPRPDEPRAGDAPAGDAPRTPAETGGDDTRVDGARVDLGYPAVDAAARFLDPADSRLSATERILELAEDDDVPLLDRLRNLAAVAAGLDAAFVGDDDGTVAARSGRARALVVRHAYCFHHAVLPALAKAGIELARWDDLRDPEKEPLRSLFRDLVFPVLTPLASVRTPPDVPAGALHLAVLVKDHVSAVRALAWLRVPSSLPRFVRARAVDGSVGVRLVPLEDVIAANLTRLFSGMQVLENHPFRMTRTRNGGPARLEVEESITPEVLDMLAGELGVDDADVHRIPGPLDLTGLSHVADLERPDLQRTPFTSATHPDMAHAEGRGPGAVFAVLRERDVLVHHPYDSFETSVQALVDNSAADPDVLAIKVVLGEGGPRVEDPLAVAAKAGKQVVVVIDRTSDPRSRAIADGRQPRAWVEALTAAGCQIAYGAGGSRVHGRALLVVRSEPDGKVRRYCHLGTGAYLPRGRETDAGQLREDLGLLTADREVAEDLSDLFNHLTGYSSPAGYRRLLTGPRSLRPGLVNRIERELGHCRAGRPARIRIKCNAVTDRAIVEALYRASRFGVPVDVWVRGACVLRPQVPGLSETIRVRSILGRFVEHSRILAFDNGGDHEVWIGSADLVPTHLDRRVETYVRLATAEHRRQLVHLFETVMDGGARGWDLAADGTWTRTRDSARRGARQLVDLHEQLIRTRLLR